MNKYNTNLPQVEIPQPPKTPWLSKNYLLAYLFVFMAFTLAIAFIYEAQYGLTQEEANDQEPQICIQVITSARHLKTGAVRDFPTPCDVPAGWEKLNKETEINN